MASGNDGKKHGTNQLKGDTSYNGQRVRLQENGLPGTGAGNKKMS